MLIISEDLAKQLVSVEAAIAALEHTFAAMATGQAYNYPVVREVLGYQDAVFGVKTGADVSVPLLGLKAGGFWPHNLKKGLTNHQSSTLLFDPETGRASALVSANYLTGIRTGAASAIATKHLARPDATDLGVIGTGGQSAYQLRATLEVRGIRRVHAWDQSADNLARFGTLVAELGLDYVPAETPEQVARAADVLITVTPSQKAMVEKNWVRPGTHINAMGADTKGKQELDPALVASAAIFVDEAAQAITIGECQHAFASGLITAEDIRGSIGAVIAGLSDGRRSDAEITLFDGTGVSLQDLVVAHLAVAAAEARQLGTRVDY
ncbi:MAG TPA: ornithine cyclodeaminase family protein [Devosiaceae bacterium]|nr:ornithine cyclodeaminase family protein [Devosiaceae bacterium]